MAFSKKEFLALHLIPDQQAVVRELLDSNTLSENEADSLGGPVDFVACATSNDGVMFVSLEDTPRYVMQDQGNEEFSEVKDTEAEAAQTACSHFDYDITAFGLSRVSYHLVDYWLSTRLQEADEVIIDVLGMYVWCTKQYPSVLEHPALEAIYRAAVRVDQQD